MHKTLSAVLILVLVAGASSAQESNPRGGRPFIGVSFEAVTEIPQVARDAGAEGGIRITDVTPNSAAALAGIAVGDLLISVCGEFFKGEAAEINNAFSRSIQSRSPGDEYPVKLVRVVEGTPTIIDVTVILGVRPEDTFAPPPPNDEVEVRFNGFPEELWTENGFEGEINPPVIESDYRDAIFYLTDSFAIRDEYRDLLARLARCESGSDGYRNDIMAYVHRDPPVIERVTRWIANRFRASGERDASNLFQKSFQLMCRGQDVYLQNIVFNRTDDLDALILKVEQVFAKAKEHVDLAFKDLTPEDIELIESHRLGIVEVMRLSHLIQSDSDLERRANNLKIIEFAKKVDFTQLGRASLTLSKLVEFENTIYNRCSQIFRSEIRRPILFEKDTPFGKFIIGGRGRSWYREDAALIIDLGGDDVYTNNAGAGFSREMPMSVVIDFAGNDSYEQTTNFSAGTGSLGVGILYDAEGDDNYIGQSVSLGSGYFGAGMLIDKAGNDRYHSEEFSQGMGFFGVGILLDEAGNDVYEAPAKAQALGMSGGFGILIDSAGDDSYYAKGRYQTNYGDEGIFDSWSQGCAMGLRGVASGGLALLLDEGGNDRFEAGNFSQGGGYYYGYGMQVNLGGGNDRYIGSRYNQGFAAHQAVGCFIEEGGDDFYTTRQAVAQGLSWDETAVVFVDDAGNDRYEGGGFSQGASAHNGFCMFIDRGGDDEYLYCAPARAGGNDYHGGHSFSIFLDEGGGNDTYGTDGYENNLVWGFIDYGFFADLSGPLENILLAEVDNSGMQRRSEIEPK
ncbi:MAG: PDZ domain-containing protein [Planctomycetes bacterium]|nr:PDZ domain-containing protein [Planctomycetota bacterium]